MAPIPLIRDTVLSHGWMDAQMFANLTAVAESTPGPIMVNLATYVGAAEAGLPGALVATLGVVLPSFVLILLVSRRSAVCWAIRQYGQRSGHQALSGRADPGGRCGALLRCGILRRQC